MAPIVRVQRLNLVKIRFSNYRRYLFHVDQCTRTVQGLKLTKYVSSRTSQWPRPKQSKFLSQTNLSTNLQHKRSKKTLHAPKAQHCDNDEANISENLSILEELNDGGELFSEKSTAEIDGLPELKKGGQSRRRNDSFVDEAARLAEIDACLFCGNVDDAIQVFNRCRRKGHKFNISTFNAILHGLAAKKRVLDFQVFHHNMAADHVMPNVQTYAAMLELYGQLNDMNVIRDTCVKMNNKGYDIKYIFQKAILTKEQATRVLKALRLVYPNYEAEIYEETPPEYISPLVQPLYTENETGVKYIPDIPESLVQDAMENFEKQLQQETVGFGTITSVERSREKTKNDEDNHANFLQIQSGWKERLTRAIEREIELVMAGNKVNKRRKTRSFTRIMVPCAEYADLAVEAITGPVCSQLSGAPLNYLCWLVGTQVYNRYTVKHKEKSGVVDKIRSMYEQFAKLVYDPEGCKRTNPREMWLQVGRTMPYEGSIYCDVQPWPSSVRVLVGCTLIDMLIRECKIDSNMFNHKRGKITPAFFHTYEYEHTTVSGYIKPHPAVVQLYQGHVNNCGNISLPATKLPMLVPPRPWTSITDGGHLLFSGNTAESVCMSRLLPSVNYAVKSDGS